MKIVVASNGDSLNSDISPVLGKCPYFIISDVENGEIKNPMPVKNPAENEKSAGSIAAQFIVDNGTDILITGRMGPIAFHLLKNEGIEVYKAISGSVEKNLKRFVDGKLGEITTLSDGFPG